MSIDQLSWHSLLKATIICFQMKCCTAAARGKDHEATSPSVVESVLFDQHSDLILFVSVFEMRRDLLRFHPLVKQENQSPRGGGHSYIFLYGDVPLSRVSFSGLRLQDRVSVL